MSENAISILNGAASLKDPDVKLGRVPDDTNVWRGEIRADSDYGIVRIIRYWPESKTGDIPKDLKNTARSICAQLPDLDVNKLSIQNLSHYLQYESGVLFAKVRPVNLRKALVEHIGDLFGRELFSADVKYGNMPEIRDAELRRIIPAQVEPDIIEEALEQSYPKIMEEVIENNLAMASKWLSLPPGHSRFNRKLSITRHNFVDQSLRNGKWEIFVFQSADRKAQEDYIRYLYEKGTISASPENRIYVDMMFRATNSGNGTGLSYAEKLREIRFFIESDAANAFPWRPWNHGIRIAYDREKDALSLFKEYGFSHDSPYQKGENVISLANSEPITKENFISLADFCDHGFMSSLFSAYAKIGIFWPRIVDRETEEPATGMRM